MGFEILSIGSPAREIAKHMPCELLQIGQRTRLQGKSGLYVVVSIDPDRQTADLIASAGITPVLKRVPFQLMHPVTGAMLEGSDDRMLPLQS